MGTIAWCLLFFAQINFGNVFGDCTLSLNKDFGNPVYAKNGRILAADSNGTVTLKRSDTILIACPGTKRHLMINNQTTSYNEVFGVTETDFQEAHCINNETFRVDRWIGQFSAIKCNIQPWFTAEPTGAQCYGRSKYYKVGYKLRSTFLALYHACFDDELQATLYVAHELSPDNKIQITEQRPQFVEGGLFGKVRMSELYKAKNQEQRLDHVLGANMSSHYISKKQFLTRGHLAPRADFPLSAAQRASFHYVNTAPQWMRGNAGDWAALEEALRRRVRSLGRPVRVHTGAHRVLALADRGGAMKPFYLGVDANNNELVPVPLYFYKLVYDPKTKKAAAFVSINSSFYTDDTIAKLTFCDDVCDENPNYKWLRWRANDDTFSFCCDYEQFVDEVKHLPRLDVQGLFY